MSELSTETRRRLFAAAHLAPLNDWRSGEKPAAGGAGLIMLGILIGAALAALVTGL